MYQLAVEQTHLGYIKDELSINSAGYFSANFRGFELRTAYQPIVKVESTTDTQVFGYEGLLRCQKGTSYISPPQFFEAVSEPDRAYVERICHELHVKNWQPWHRSDGCLFINLDVRLLESKYLSSRSIAVGLSKAQLWGVDPHQLVCEVIESKAYSLKALQYLTDCLKDFGVGVAVDDFGTDYSNISRVRMLKPDYVKLDGGFFHRFSTNGRLLPMLRALVQRLRDEGAEVIIEAVETEHERDTALDCDISLMQGYLFGAPKMLS